MMLFLAINRHINSGLYQSACFYLKRGQNPASCFYKLFSDPGPDYIKITNIVIFTGLLLGPVTDTSVKEPEASLHNHEPQSGWNLDAFHAGHGMCSLLHNEHQEIMFDVGTGMTLSKKTYSLIKNNKNGLRLAINELKITIVLSNLDYDHWNLLDFDCHFSAN